MSDAPVEEPSELVWTEARGIQTALPPRQLVTLETVALAVCATTTAAMQVIVVSGRAHHELVACGPGMRHS